MFRHIFNLKKKNSINNTQRTLKGACTKSKTFETAFYEEKLCKTNKDNKIQATKSNGIVTGSIKPIANTFIGPARDTLAGRTAYM